MDGDSIDERKSLSFAMSVVAVGNVNVIFVTLCNVHHNFACSKRTLVFLICTSLTVLGIIGLFRKSKQDPKENRCSRRLTNPICNKKFPSGVWYLKSALIKRDGERRTGGEEHEEIEIGSILLISNFIDITLQGSYSLNLLKLHDFAWPFRIFHDLR